MLSVIETVQKNNIQFQNEAKYSSLRLKPFCIIDDKVCPNVAEDGKKTKQVKDVTNIPKSLKSSAKVPDKSAGWLI